MRLQISATALLLALAAASPGLAQSSQGHAGHGPAAGGAPAASPYAGLEARSVAGLSDDDIAALRRGEGWGLALAAELNGVPGPSHLLDLRAELGLSPDQVAALQAAFDAMRAEAVAAGARLIAAETALDRAFRDGAPTGARLRALVEEAGAARAALQYAHLSRHLSTLPLLTPDQIARYAALRGYAPRD